MVEIKKKIRWILKYSYAFRRNLLVLIVLGSLVSVSHIIKAMIMKELIDSATMFQISRMVTFLFYFMFFIILDLVMQAIISILSTKTQTTLYLEIQRNIYINMSNSRWMNISKYHSGDILTRFTSDAENIASVIATVIPNIISLSILLLGSLILLLYYAPILALSGVLVAPIIILLGHLYSTKIKDLVLYLQQVESKYRGNVHEAIQNIVIIKSFCLENDKLLKTYKLQQEKLAYTMKKNRVSILYNSIISFGSCITFIIVFAWGALNLSKGSVTYGSLTALLQLINNIQGPLSGLASNFPKTISLLPSIDRLMELEIMDIDIKSDNINVIDNPDILFDNVCFSYDSNKTILKNIKLKIYNGEIVGIVGPSGEGKTTLIRLLLSLIYPSTGHVYLDTNNVKIEINATHRNLISYVPQGNTLFSGTIEENLRCGNKNATDEELVIALESVSAWDFVKNLDKGLYTIIGENGIGLSEGQAQRIAIARALLKKCPIIILDEATSALDSETEIKVLTTIGCLENKPTIIVITHRPSALDICSRILKLDQGHLTEISKFITETAVD